jgi:GT2 family glycosyltransferase
MQMTEAIQIGAVIIGRNEGARLVRCLASIVETVDRIVYVDSGSEDDSIAQARKVGADVVILDTDLPFTAARARNAGLEHLTLGGNFKYVQFIDGDCELETGWIAKARDFLEGNPKCVVAFGRRKEKFPEASVYNRLCDVEWNTPIGQSRSCGGDTLMCVDALLDVGGFNPNLIAGEEPELCVRLRAKGWQIWRLDHAMTLHDAAILRFSQWWKRARRGGHAFAEGAALHGSPPEEHNVAQVRRALVWGLILPIVILTLSIGSVWALLILLVYPFQVFRLAMRHGIGVMESWENAFFLTLSKFPETVGIMLYWWGQVMGKRVKLIEYK